MKLLAVLTLCLAPCLLSQSASAHGFGSHHHVVTAYRPVYVAPAFVPRVVMPVPRVVTYRVAPTVPVYRTTTYYRAPAAVVYRPRIFRPRTVLYW